MERDYHKPTLRKVPGKTSWYVVVTKPKALQKGPKDKFIRRSIGTSDKRVAEKLVHSKAEQIYKEFDKQLNADPFIAFVRKHWELDWSFEDYLSRPPLLPLKDGPEARDNRKLVVCEYVCNQNDTFDQRLAENLFQYLNKKEATAWKVWLTYGENPYPILIQQEQIDADLSEKAVQQQKEIHALNRTGAPKLSEFIEKYEEDKYRWRSISSKEKGAQLRRLHKVIQLIGDIPVDQVTKPRVLDVAEHLEGRNLANSTITYWINSLTLYLNWIEDTQFNTFVNPQKPWITGRPLQGLSIGKYGKKKRSFEAFTPEQLHHLFSLKMPEEHRLILSILVTTGMRLDEAALLDWTQYKIDRNGLRYFDLSLGAKVKNDRFSARTVAIPDCLKLPEKSEGRLFSFRIGADEKSASHASRVLTQYTHAVRFDEKDDRKVVHSLRHNLAGFMINLKPTPSSELMNWITGHDMDGRVTQSERTKTYGQDPDVSVKYEIVNRIEHPWLR